jgi:hypothetical protein
MSTGAPSIFTQEIADKICEELATSSKSLRTICKEDNMPSVRTVLYWLSQGEKEDAKPELRDFLHQYARAREAQADHLVEEIIEIADDGSNDLMTITKGDISYEQENKEVTNRSKLRVEARKWIASKLKPKKYGDKVDLNHGGEIAVKQITGMEVK